METLIDNISDICCISVVKETAGTASGPQAALAGVSKSVSGNEHLVSLLYDQYVTSSQAGKKKKKEDNNSIAPASSDKKLEQICARIVSKYAEKARLLTNHDLFKLIYQDLIMEEKGLTDDEQQKVISMAMDQINRIQKENHPIIKISKELSKNTDFNKLVATLKESNYQAFKDKTIMQSYNYPGFSEVISHRYTEMIQLGNQMFPGINPVVFALTIDKIEPLEEYLISDDTVSMYIDLIKNPEFISSDSPVFKMPTSTGKIFNAKSNVKANTTLQQEMNYIRAHIYLRYMIYHLRSGNFVIEKNIINEFNAAIGNKTSPADVVRSIFRIVGFEPLLCTRENRMPLSAISVQIKYNEFNQITFDNDYILTEENSKFIVRPDDGTSVGSMMKNEMPIGFNRDLYNSYWNTIAMNSGRTSPLVLDAKGVLVVEIDRTPNTSSNIANIFNAFVSSSLSNHSINFQPISHSIDNLVQKTINGKLFELSSALCWKTNDLGSISDNINYIDGYFCLKRIKHKGVLAWFCYDTKNIRDIRREIMDREEEGDRDADSNETNELLKRIERVVTNGLEINNIVPMTSCIIPYNDGIHYIQRQSAVLIYTDN